VDGFREDPGDRRYVSLNWVAPRYFETFGTEWVAGRDFTVEDQGRPRVAIVNRAFARYYFPDIDAIGRRFTFEGQNRSYEIVGVVGDAKYSSLREAPPRTIYLHAYQEGPASQLAVRTDTRTAAIAGAVRRAVGDVLKTVPITKLTTLTEQLDASILPERQMARLSGAFGALGALLAALGLYGLLAFTVARRTTEIGIRVALGATRRDVSLMVLKGALGLVAAGLVAGTLIAIWSRRLAASLLEGLPVESSFPIAFGAAAIIVVALLAAYVPARRAAGIDPIEALRRE
jgi:predicted permease